MITTLKNSMEILRYIAVILFVFVGFLLIQQANQGQAKTDRNYRLGQENNTYLRVIACVSSETPTKRTPDYVKLCYLQAEQHNNTKVEHFGDGK